MTQIIKSRMLVVRLVLAVALVCAACGENPQPEPQPPSKPLRVFEQLPAPNGRTASLCNTDHRIVFSCRLENGKRVSLCAIRGDASDRLQYRYGRPESIELSHPPAEVPSHEVFYFDSYSRRGGCENSGLDLATLTLQRGSYAYQIDTSFDVCSGESREALKVYEGDPTLSASLRAEYSCKNVSANELGALVRGPLDRSHR